MRFFKMAVAVDPQHHGFKSFAERPLRCRLQSYDSHLYDYTLIMPEFDFAHSLKQAFEAANINIHRSLSTPCLPTTKEEHEFDANYPKTEMVGGHSDPRARALVAEVAMAIASGVVPVPVSSGLGGAYFLHGRHNDAIAVIKPSDEEPLAFNNPKGFAGRMLGQPGVKRSIRVGETGVRELAAYLLDKGGFAGVPPTALVKISHVSAFHLNSDSQEISQAPPVPYKVASLQQFIDHDSDAGDLGPSSFSVSSIHRIGILDVRLLNLDRHAGNMLVKHGHELVPIDHGLCLPEWLDDPYFEWLHWPQASIPFSDSEVEYTLNLDPFEDAELLRNELPSIRESSIRVCVLCTIFLKQAVVAGLCLADIGEMMTREFHGGEENLSILESTCLNAKAMITSPTSSTLSDRNGNGYQCEDKQEETEIFQFDDDYYGDGFSQALDLPLLLQGHPDQFKGKPPVTEKARSTRGLFDSVLPPLNEEYVHKSDSGGGGSGREYKVGGIARSVTFSVSNNRENGVISLGEISEEEWELFLENFQKILPKAFEDRKNMGLMKQRLGTSCEF
ncbi:phosphatidylinositol 4-kinase gamma 8-like [Actinidia eriantha]|uniref:phosphatidylinositol 4-kinase gamma 8-like n=1 Tax=Actinidia eriantha TaxID=165200 RepID=UPI00258D84F6|nr:phosphatidylinositol 4-kinase gamma 8-like [Actinidia eriantha]